VSSPPNSLTVFHSCPYTFLTNKCFYLLSFKEIQKLVYRGENLYFKEEKKEGRRARNLGNGTMF